MTRWEWRVTCPQCGAEFTRRAVTKEQAEPPICGVRLGHDVNRLDWCFECRMGRKVEA